MQVAYCSHVNWVLRRRVLAWIGLLVYALDISDTIGEKAARWNDRESAVAERRVFAKRERGPKAADECLVYKAGACLKWFDLSFAYFCVSIANDNCQVVQMALFWTRFCSSLATQSIICGKSRNNQSIDMKARRTSLDLQLNQKTQSKILSKKLQPLLAIKTN